MSPTVRHEVGNIQKCLAAGFEQVASISSDRKTLNKAKELAAESLGKEDTVRGYKVKLQYRPVGETEKKVRKQAIAQTILQALRRLKAYGKRPKSP